MKALDLLWQLIRALLKFALYLAGYLLYGALKLTAVLSDALAKALKTLLTR